MAANNTVLFEIEGAVATVTLNRPACLNALNMEMVGKIRLAMQEIEQNHHVRAMILTGAGHDFCSGYDPRDLAGAGSDIIAGYAQACFSVRASIRSSRVPIIIAVNGSAAGAGLSLALCGDWLLATHSANFVQVPGQLGAEPGPDSSSLQSAAIGSARYRDAMTTSEPVSAERALQWGVINECLEAAELLPRATELAATLAKGPTRALVLSRQLVDEGAQNSFAAQYRRELEVNRELRECLDGVEGVQAFLEKRPAQFRGE